MSQRNFSIVFLAVIISYACHVRADRIRHARYLGQAIEMIEQRALYGATRQELFEGAMHGMIAVLDQKGDHHSAFIGSRITESYLSELEQEIVGIGVRISLKAADGEEEKKLTVVESPLVGSPAFRAKIRKGDRILAIQGEVIAGWTMDQIIQKIRGDEGEPVVLTIERDKTPRPFDVQVVRETIDLPSVLGDLCDTRGKWSYLLPPDDQIALIRITSFGAKTTEELRAVLEDLTQKNVRGLILDVRDNPGGELISVVDICSLFLSQGSRIVSTHDREGHRLELFVAEREGPYQKIPLAILINGNSASASEILAACLQDNGRAVILGERSFGKGTVQQLLMMEGGRSRLKLTSHEYHRPSEKNIHRANRDTPESETWGVLPSEGFLVEQSDEEELAWRKARQIRDEAGLVEQNHGEALPELIDLPRERAIEYLRKQIAREAEKPKQRE